MAEAPKTKIRPAGATASLGRTGFPHIVSATGGEIDIVTGASQAGFNPLDLLYASLSACLAMSARIAAHDLELTNRIEHIEVEVSGEKAKEGHSRIESFALAFRIIGDLDKEMRQRVIERAEDICTVSNTLAGKPAFTITLGD